MLHVNTTTWYPGSHCLRHTLTHTQTLRVNTALYFAKALSQRIRKYMWFWQLNYAVNICFSSNALSYPKYTTLLGMQKKVHLDLILAFLCLLVCLFCSWIGNCIRTNNKNRLNTENFARKREREGERERERDRERDRERESFISLLKDVFNRVLHYLVTCNQRGVFVENKDDSVYPVFVSNCDMCLFTWCFVYIL